MMALYIDAYMRQSASMSLYDYISIVYLTVVGKYLIQFHSLISQIYTHSSAKLNTVWSDLYY